MPGSRSVEYFQPRDVLKRHFGSFENLRSVTARATAWKYSELPEERWLRESISAVHRGLAGLLGLAQYASLNRFVSRTK